MKCSMHRVASALIALSRRCAARAALATALMAGTGAGAANIFDDDWTPAKRQDTPPPAPTPPKPVPPIPTPPTPVQPPSPAVVNSPATNPPAITPPVAIPRRPIPEKAALTRSREVLKDAFAQQLADHSIAARRPLAETLLAEASKAAENPPDQFALFGGAYNAAKEAASLRLVCRVSDEMARAYEVDVASMKGVAALSMPLKADSPTHTIDNVFSGLEVVDALIASEDFASASKLCVLLRPLASADPGLLGVLQKRAAEVEGLRAARDKVAAQMKALAASPADPAANSAVGGYYCFIVGDWDKGLAMLAIGSDAELQKLAKDDLAYPVQADALLRLGDGWWNISTKQAPAAQLKIRQHAAALYGPCVATASPLQRIKIEKRIADAGGARPGDAALREAIIRQNVARLSAFRDQHAGRPGVARMPLKVDEPSEGEIAWPANGAGFSLAREVMVGYNAGNHGRTRKETSANVVIAPGFSLEGGTLLVSKGVLDLRGEPSKPIFLRNVKIDCELTGTVKASNVIFEKCTFVKGGAFFWGEYSSKWIMEDCLLLQSNFKGLNKLDYGLKLKRSTFVSCKFPKRSANATDDSAKTARSEWGRIGECDFFDCELSASVFWSLQRCNLFGCKSADNATFNSKTDLPIELGLSADERDRFLTDLRGRTTMSDTGRVVFSGTSAQFPNQAFPKP